MAEQQAALTQAMTALTRTEGEAANVAQALKAADTNSPAGQELAAKVEQAAKLVAEATAAHQRSQKAFGEAKAAADKSAAAMAAEEADTTKLKGDFEAAQKGLQAASEVLKQAETAKAAAAETAKKEIGLLQSADAQAKAALEAARAGTSELQAKLDKTEKFSDAFKETSQRLEAANKLVASLRTPADRDRKEVGDLQAALEKIKAAAATADAEAA
jgi:DNA repair exonuclease SbcCD ATPase subunit